MEFVEKLVNNKFLWLFVGLLNLSGAVVTVLTRGNVLLLLVNIFFMIVSVYYFTKASSTEK